MDLLLEKNKITLPAGTRRVDHEENTEEHEEIFHALKEIYSKTHAFLIESRASNHMVASRQSFYSLQSTDGPSIHMGDDSQIRAKGKGSIKLKYGKFNDLLYVPP